MLTSTEKCNILAMRIKLYISRPDMLYMESIKLEMESEVKSIKESMDQRGENFSKRLDESLKKKYGASSGSSSDESS